MNPSFKKGEHALALDLYNRQPDISVVMATAGYYRLDLNRAKEVPTGTCMAILKSAGIEKE